MSETLEVLGLALIVAGVGIMWGVAVALIVTGLFVAYIGFVWGEQ